MITQTQLAALKYKPTAKAVRRELDRLGISQLQAADLLRINPRTMRRYVQDAGTPGALAMPFPAFVLIKMLEPRDG